MCTQQTEFSRAQLNLPSQNIAGAAFLTDLARFSLLTQIVFSYLPLVPARQKCLWLDVQQVWVLFPEEIWFSARVPCPPMILKKLISETHFLAYLKVVVAKKEPFFQKWRIRFRDYDSVHQRSLLFVRQGA